MKKIIQLTVAILIIAIAQTAQAGHNKHPKYVAPAAPEVISVSAKTPKPLGGEMPPIIVVYDLNNKPIQGATVSAPCTGLANKLTDATGTAVFDTGPTCPCSENACTVSTPAGCLQQIKISCGTYRVICNK